MSGATPGMPAGSLPPWARRLALPLRQAREPALWSLLGIAAGATWLLMPWYWAGALNLSALLVLAVFRQVEHGLYLTLALLPVDLTHLRLRLDNPTYAVLVFPYIVPLLLTFAALCAHACAGTRKMVFSSPVSAPLFIGVAYLWLSLLWAPHPLTGFALGALLGAHLMFFVLLLSLVTDEDSLRRTTNVLIAVGYAVTAGVIASQWIDSKAAFELAPGVTMRFNFGEVTNRPSGFGNTNNMSGYLAMTTLLVYGRLVVSKRRRETAWYFFTICVFVVGIITTSSRGGMIGLVAGAVLIFAVHPLARAHFLRNTLFSLLLLLVSVLVAKPSYIDRMLVGFGYSGGLIFEKTEEVSIDKSAEQTGNISGMGQRYSWWKLGLREMTDRPHKLLLGLGLGGFISYAQAIHTHSLVLSFFFDMGLPGVLLLGAGSIILARGFTNILRNGKKDYAYFMFVGAFVAFVAETGIHGLIDYDFYSYTAKMFWLPFGYMLAVYNMAAAGNPHG